ncbi:heme oxygenase-like protein [Corynespora cassiicola Philippines]|uniref:Heme oxygenase-like protein n=1 Tax=Corynespora cassiicola Philippines TaxID=1448308 RepID=A0A2T2NL53_CORCC|nr:heme oxygenase-like protein [Corynespora cassiicola Philippines]
MKDAVLPTSLPGEINAATRSLHTVLNRLITSRLPLALPPYASDPELYTKGLLHFSHIFLTFESLWTDLLQSTHPASSPPTSPILSFLLVNPYDAPEMFSSPPSPRMLDFLTKLRPKGLARSARLKADLESLTALHPTDLSVLLAQYPGDKVGEFCLHMRRAVKQRPHVLVAYAWCFYMAVFSGGRWIRGELVKGGEQFWRTNTGIGAGGEETVSLGDKGLSFWNFDGELDGEDIKAEFKQRLALAEDLFTMDERIDVIEEAKTIFARCNGLVEELDSQLATDLAAVGSVERGQRSQRAAAAAAAAAVAPSGQVGGPVMPGGDKSQGAVMWLRRPEVTGTVVALGCLACVALLRLEF